jgi:hypothetical protein
MSVSDLIAVVVLPDVVVAGLDVPAHRMLEVVDDLADVSEGQAALTHAQARALVQAGYAEAVEADFDELSSLIDGWQRTG